MALLSNSMRSSKIFQYFLIQNFMFCFFTSPVLFLSRDVFQCPQNVNFSIAFSVVYFFNFYLLSVSDYYFYLCFNFLTNKKLENFFFKIRFYIPYTNSNFLVIIFICSLVALLFNKQESIYMHYYSLFLDSFRLFLAPCLLYFAFLKNSNPVILLSSLEKKNYFFFKNTTFLEMKFLLEAMNVKANFFNNAPIEKKLLYLTLLTAPAMLGLEKGGESKSQICAQINRALDNLNKDKEFFFNHYGSEMNPQQKQFALDRFAEVHNELSKVLQGVVNMSDTSVGLGWYSNILGLNNATWNTLNQAADYANKKSSYGLANITRDTFRDQPGVIQPVSKYPSGSIGEIRDRAGLGNEISSVNPYSAVEFSCISCQKIISLFF